MDLLLAFFADLTAAAAISLGVGAAAAVSLPVLLLSDAHRSDFDPRPALRRVVESGRVDGLLVAVTGVQHDARELVAGVVLDARLTARETALTAAAFLALLVPTEALR